MKKKEKKQVAKQDSKQGKKKIINITGFIRTIGFKLRVIPLILIISTMSVVAVVSITQTRMEMSSLVEENAVIQAEHIRDQVQSNNEFNTYMEEDIKGTIKGAAEEVLNQDGKISNKVITKIADTLDNLNVKEINVIDASGTVIYSNQKTNLGYVHDKDSMVWKVINGKTDFLVEDIKQSTASKDYYQYGYMGNGRIFIQVGVLANDYQASVEKTKVQQVVEKVAKEYGLVYVEYVDSDMNIAGHSVAGLIGTTSSSESVKQAMSTKTNYTRVTEYEGQEVYEVTVPITTSSGTDVVQVASTLNKVNEVANNMRKSVTIMEAITFILTTLIMNWVASSVIKPLQKLSETAGDVAKGDLTKEIKIKAYKRDIIGKLADSFIVMRDSLNLSIKAIQGGASESSSMSEGLSTNSKQMEMTATEVTNAIQEVAKVAESAGKMEGIAKSLYNETNKFSI